METAIVRADLAFFWSLLLVPCRRVQRSAAARGWGGWFHALSGLAALRCDSHTS